MRFPLLPALVLLALSDPIAAQTLGTGPRVTATLSVGHVALTPVFDHDPDFSDDLDSPMDPGAEYRDRTRLSLTGARATGARVAVRVAPRWSVYADGAYGGTEYGYLRQSGTYLGGELGNGSETRASESASITRVALGVSRRFAVRPTSEVEVGVGGAFSRLELERHLCSPGSAYDPLCGVLFPEGVKWETRYDLPGAAATLVLRQRILGRIALEGRTDYSVGRADTEGFHVDLVPEAERYEAPKRVTVHMGVVSVGAAVGF